MTPINAIIFDYDDTLVRTREIRYATIKTIAKDVFSTLIETTEIDSAWGLPGDSFLIRLFGKYANDDLEKLWAIYNEYCDADPNKLHDGVLDFFKEFESSLQFGILTSSSKRRVLPELSALGLAASLFIDIQTAEDSKVHKPEPLVFEPICNKFTGMGIDRSAILYVGDAMADFKAATGFGLSFIGMAHTEREKAIFRNGKISHVDSFSQLSDFLRSG
jgi:phosphoglycolate phosphatase